MKKTIEWDESLSLGIREIDEDHKMLIRYYNGLLTACLVSSGSAVVNASFSKLIEHKKQHFLREEKLMEKESYPGITEQRNEHDRLLQTILELQKKMPSDSDATACMDTLDFLYEWLVNHIMGLDKDFARFVHRRQWINE